MQLKAFIRQKYILFTASQVIWFDRIWIPTETGQRNNVSAVHWRHRIVPTRKWQMRESYMKCYIPFIFLHVLRTCIALQRDIGSRES